MGTDADADAGPTLLVTVGSTLFPHMTSTLLTTDSLDLLSAHLSALRVQIGKGDIPNDLAGRIGSSEKGEGGGEGMKGVWKGMEVDVFRYTDDFEGLVESVDLVVSHAGTSPIFFLPTCLMIFRRLPLSL